MKIKKHLQQIGRGALLASPFIVASLMNHSAVAAELEEVIVTAQKRQQSQQDVPLSVTTISSENMDVMTSGSASVNALAGRIPSVNVENGNFGRIFPRPYIRGLGNTDFDLNGSQPVSYIYDEVVYENPVLKGFPIFDMERFEVLRGPQGTLFGRNTPAGILKFESRKPTHETDGYLTASAGRFGQADLESAIGGSLIEDVLAARISLLYNSRDNWVDNKFTGEKDAEGGYEDYAARLQFLWTPSEDFSALFNIHGHKLNSNTTGFRANLFSTGSNDLNSQASNQDEVYTDAVNNQELDAWGITAKLEYGVGDMTYTSITGYESLDVFSRGDVDGGFGAVFLPGGSGPGPGIIPFASETRDGLSDHYQFTQEFRMSSEAFETVEWQLGLFFFEEEYDVTSEAFDTLAGSTPDGFTLQNQKTSSWAVFSHVDWDVTDQFVVSLGLRYSEDKKKFSARRISVPFATQLFDGGVPTSAPIEKNPSDEVVSWDISGTYFVNDDINAYARIGSSFRAPSIQGRLLFAPGDGADAVTVAKTEDIISYEAGVKSELFARTLRLNFATYYYQMNDQQLTAIGGDININRLVNADETEGYGFETDITWLPSDNWLITAGLSFNHTEIQDADLAVGVCGSPCTVIDPVNGSGQAMIDGNSLPNAPEWIGNFTIRYGISVGAGELYVLTDWYYMDEASFLLYESVEFTAKERVEGGLRIGYLFDNDMEVAVYGRNILDEDYAVAGVDFNNLAGSLNDPAVWGIQFRKNFF